MLKKYRFLLLRRFVQVGILVLFIGGNVYGWSFLKGNLSSSLLLETIPLSDPYALLQMFSAGALISIDIFIGAVIIVLFYGIIGGRSFCSWVCPINIVADFASLIRRVLQWDKIERRVWMKRTLRYWVLGLSLAISAIAGVAAFEMVSPIGMLNRGLIFGMGMGMAAVSCIFLFDLFVIKNGWCGYVCPLGGMYSLVGAFSLVKVSHDKEKCTECMECKLICPEKQVLHIVAKESGFISSGECTNCGRCVEVCQDDALNFSFRLKKEIGEYNVKK